MEKIITCKHCGGMKLNQEEQINNQLNKILNMIIKDGEDERELIKELLKQKGFSK